MNARSQPVPAVHLRPERNNTMPFGEQNWLFPSHKICYDHNRKHRITKRRNGRLCFRCTSANGGRGAVQLTNIGYQKLGPTQSTTCARQEMKVDSTWIEYNSWDFSFATFQLRTQRACCCSLSIHLQSPAVLLRETQDNSLDTPSLLTIFSQVSSISIKSKVLIPRYIVAVAISCFLVKRP